MSTVDSGTATTARTRSSRSSSIWAKTNQTSSPTSPSAVRTPAPSRAKVTSSVGGATPWDVSVESFPIHPHRAATPVASFSRPSPAVDFGASTKFPAAADTPSPSPSPKTSHPPPRDAAVLLLAIARARDRFRTLPLNLTASFPASFVPPSPRRERPALERVASVYFRRDPPLQPGRRHAASHIAAHRARPSRAPRAIALERSNRKKRARCRPTTPRTARPRRSAPSATATTLRSRVGDEKRNRTERRIRRANGRPRASRTE